MAKGMTKATALHEFEKFKNYHLRQNTRSEAWSRDWATWYLNWVTYGSNQVGSNGRYRGNEEPRRQAREVYS
jgi:hypothetical protein